MQAAERVGELEQEKAQEFDALEQSRSELVVGPTELQSTMTALAGTERSEAPSRAALIAQVALLQDFVITCNHIKIEFALVISATQHWEAHVVELDSRVQAIQKQKHELEGVVAQAGRVCGQAATDLAVHILRSEELEQKA